MEVLRSVMFGLLTVSLILDITTHWSASASPGYQSQISPENIKDLNELMKQTRTDANRTFWDNCLVEKVYDCSQLYNSASTNSNLPSCVCDKKQNQMEVLREQYKVCKEFAQLLDQLTEAKRNLTARLSSSLTFLRKNSLQSVTNKFLQLKFDVQDVTTTVTIADDSSLHIKKILGTVARMAVEMDKMSKVLACLQRPASNIFAKTIST